MRVKGCCYLHVKSFLTCWCKTIVDPRFTPLESRDNHELELDFKRLWEEFRSSSSEKVLTLIIHTLVYALVIFSECRTFNLGTTSLLVFSIPDGPTKD